MRRERKQKQDQSGNHGGQTDDDDDGNLCKSNWQTIIFPANCFELRASDPASVTRDGQRRYVESLLMLIESENKRTKCAD